MFWDFIFPYDTQTHQTFEVDLLLFIGLQDQIIMCCT